MPSLEIAAMALKLAELVGGDDRVHQMSVITGTPGAASLSRLTVFATGSWLHEPVAPASAIVRPRDEH
jgi:hypothetical protein